MSSEGLVLEQELPPKAFPRADNSGLPLLTGGGGGGQSHAPNRHAQTGERKLAEKQVDWFQQLARTQFPLSQLLRNRLGLLAELLHDSKGRVVVPGSLLCVAGGGKSPLQHLASQVASWSPRASRTAAAAATLSRWTRQGLI